MRILRPIVVALAAASLLGCPSVSSLTSARTLDAGKTQVVLAPTFTGVGVTDGTTSVGGPGFPLMEGQVRHGLTDHIELGGKLWLGGFAGHLKFGLVRPESESDGFNLSFDPGISYMGLSAGGSGVGAVYLYVPLLAGLRFGGHELTIGPRLVPVVGGAFGSSSANSGWALLAGSSLGASFKITDSFRLLPEFSILMPTNAGPGEGTFALTQFSLGFAFGG